MELIKNNVVNFFGHNLYFNDKDKKFKYFTIEKIKRYGEGGGCPPYFIEVTIHGYIKYNHIESEVCTEDSVKTLRFSKDTDLWQLEAIPEYNEKVYVIEDNMFKTLSEELDIAEVVENMEIKIDYENEKVSCRYNVDGNVFKTNARCNKKDRFNKLVGMIIASHRLLNKIDEYNAIAKKGKEL